MFKQTALTSCDSYKLGHADQYPEGTTKVYSNFTPRSENHFNIPQEYKDGNITWFGLQGFLIELKEIWQSTFFDENIDNLVNEASSFYAPFCGPNGFNTDRLRQLHTVGYLPLEIKALPEGVRVPVGVPVLTITNTLPEFFWLPNFLETWISAELWKACTSASTSFIYRKIINKYAQITGGSKEFIDWQGHDFSVRGMSGIADAAKSGSGHLIYFTGTDNLPAVKYLNDSYFGKDTFIGGSVPATEHSAMCAGGMETELETFKRLLKTYPSGVLSIVSDTWDFWNVITNMAELLKEDILSRVPDQLGLAKTVFRPDSGDPVKIICGDISADPDTSEFKGAVECLWDIFGGTTNALGYRTLNQRVGLIYGDSITPQRAEEILKQLAAKGFASDNIVFGIGSYTFQYQTRDTLGFAMKATYVEIRDKYLPIFKDPKTDSGTKKSAKGLLAVKTMAGKYILCNNVSKYEERENNLLNLEFYNGELVFQDSITSIRKRAATYL